MGSLLDRSKINNVLPNEVNLPDLNFVNRVEDNADKIKDILIQEEYIYLVNRSESSLCMALVGMGSNNDENYSELFGFNPGYKIYHDSSGIAVANLSAAQKEASVIKNNDTKYSLMETADRCEREGRAVLEVGKLLDNEDYSKYSDNQLKELVKTAMEVMIHFCGYTNFPITVGKVFEEKINDILEKKVDNDSKKEDYFQTLMVPSDLNRSYLEQKEILKLAIDYKKEGEFTEELEEKIKYHLEDFDVLGVKNGYGERWTVKDAKRRIKDLSKHEPEKELEAIKNKPQREEKEIKNVLKELDLGDDFKETVDKARRYIYLRTFRSDVWNDYFTRLLTLLEEIAERNNLSLEAVNEAYPNEIVSFNFPEEKHLLKRKNERVALATKGRLYYAVGESYDYIKENIISDIVGGKESEDIDLIEGNTTYEGKAEGTVKIVEDNSSVDKVKDGDILVTSMTTPDFVPAMERAAAFVTDEGGILCHAAIISREMEKPCVIGTKRATSVLEDGDKVEVDADEGVVKVLDSN